MKFNTSIIFFFLLLFALNSCQEEKDAYALIEGSLRNLPINDILLSHGEEKMSIGVSPEGNFLDTLYLSEGAYWSIGDGRNMSKNIYCSWK